MFGYGNIADYQRNLREAQKYNAEFEKNLTDFFRPKPPKKSDYAIELAKSDTEIELKEIKKNGK